jgi:hypothetical protein
MGPDGRAVSVSRGRDDRCPTESRPSTNGGKRLAIWSIGVPQPSNQAALAKAASIIVWVPRENSSGQG